MPWIDPDARRCRLEFDRAEMAITTYILARSFDKTITGLPVVVSRNFHHRRMVYNAKSGIREPKDLEGKRVGMRAYTHTMPLWNCGVLQHEYGVDLDKVRGVAFEGAHVKAYQKPSNVEMAPAGKKIGAMLTDGEVDAARYLRSQGPDDGRILVETRLELVAGGLQLARVAIARPARLRASR
jgi:4,5-dihydroxyphthalate decarboxylase